MRCKNCGAPYTQSQSCEWCGSGREQPCIIFDERLVSRAAAKYLGRPGFAIPVRGDVHNAVKVLDHREDWVDV